MSADSEPSLDFVFPQCDIEYVDSEYGTRIYGPMDIVDGGLIDGGRVVPTAEAPPEADCDLTTTTCFIFDPDGQLDLGYYYVQGGQFEYGGFGAQVGVRFTF